MQYIISMNYKFLLLSFLLCFQFSIVFSQKTFVGADSDTIPPNLKFHYDSARWETHSWPSGQYSTYEVWAGNSLYRNKQIEGLKLNFTNMLADSKDLQMMIPDTANSTRKMVQAFYKLAKTMTKKKMVIGPVKSYHRFKYFTFKTPSRDTLAKSSQTVYVACIVSQKQFVSMISMEGPKDYNNDNLLYDEFKDVMHGIEVIKLPDSSILKLKDDRRKLDAHRDSLNKSISEFKPYSKPGSSRGPSNMLIEYAKKGHYTYNAYFNAAILNIFPDTAFKNAGSTKGIYRSSGFSPLFYQGLLTKIVKDKYPENDIPYISMGKFKKTYVDSINFYTTTMTLKSRDQLFVWAYQADSVWIFDSFLCDKAQNENFTGESINGSKGDYSIVFHSSYKMILASVAPIKTLPLIIPINEPSDSIYVKIHRNSSVTGNDSFLDGDVIYHLNAHHFSVFDSIHDYKCRLSFKNFRELRDYELSPDISDGYDKQDSIDELKSTAWLSLADSITPEMRFYYSKPIWIDVDNDDSGHPKELVWVAVSNGKIITYEAYKNIVNEWKLMERNPSVEERIIASPDVQGLIRRSLLKVEPNSEY